MLHQILSLFFQSHKHSVPSNKGTMDHTEPLLEALLHMFIHIGQKGISSRWFRNPQDSSLRLVNKYSAQQQLHSSLLMKITNEHHNI